MINIKLEFSGHYCPEGTIQDDQFDCLPGTFTGNTNLTSSSECDPCPQSFYCDYGTGKTKYISVF